jgi:ankyrin repeat protein
VGVSKTDPAGTSALVTSHFGPFAFPNPLTNLFGNQGATIDQENRFGMTALLAAVLTEKADLVRVVIGGGAAMDRINRHGHTALTFACEKGVDVEVVAALLEHGALAYLETFKGE